MQYAPQEPPESDHQTSDYFLQGGGAKRHNRRRLFFESLEGRELLAADMWQNPSDAMDVNGDGSVAPSDVLGIVNTINEPTLETASSLGAASGMFPDVNGDGTVAETDSALIVAQLNQSPPPSGSTSSSTTPVGGGSSKLYYLPPTLAANFTSAPGVTPGEAFEGSLIALHYHVFQPDGDELTTVDIDWGDGTPVESMTITGGWLGAGQHIYVDDNPTNTPQDQYAITITASDADGSVQKLLLATVKNADPVVLLDPIEIVDSVSAEDGGTDYQLDESERFIIRGTVTDAGVNDTFPMSQLRVDLNFDDDVLDAGETVQLSLVPDPQIAGKWRFEHTVGKVLDDEATYFGGQRVWGNDTEKDDLDFTIDLIDDDTGSAGVPTQSIEVYNVDPKLVIKSVVETPYPGEAGRYEAVTITGSITEVGTNDLHKVTITWGDGSQEVVTTDTRQFSFDRVLTGDFRYVLEDLYPVVLQVADDDKGGDEKTLPRLDIHIHRGQGGAKVLNLDEFTIGSFTVANLNDTDGDGKNADGTITPDSLAGQRQVCWCLHC